MSEPSVEEAAVQQSSSLRQSIPREQLRSLLEDYAAHPDRVPPYDSMRRRAQEPASRSAAVLVLFGVLDAEPAQHQCASVPADLDVLLVVRASGLRDHPGEIAFPGGGVEAQDATLQATALREAWEETGLDPAGVEVLGLLPAVPTVSRFEVTPVVGWWREQSRVGVVDAGESAAVFRVPVADLVDPAHRCVSVLRRGSEEWRMPAFQLPQGLLWGFTAGIVAGLLDELGWSEPWDEGVEVTPAGY